jgi:hypothetical protein
MCVPGSKADNEPEIRSKGTEISLEADHLCSWANDAPGTRSQERLVKKLRRKEVQIVMSSM